MDCIEHGSGMTRDQMVEAAARGVLVDPTVCQVATFADIASRAGDTPSTGGGCSTCTRGA